MIATLLMLGLKSLLVAVVALAALRLTRRRSAAERSTIAHLGLFALVALPLASLLLPALSIPLPEALSPPAARIVSTTEQPAPLPASAEHIAMPRLDLQSASPPAAPLASTPSLAERAAFLARYAYALPAVALLALTLIALIRLVALRARAQVVIEPLWLGALARAQRRMNFKNGTALLASTELQSPISWGLMRPTIVVNEDALAAGDRAEAIIAHELAHVIQFDWAKLMLARVATALFWFNPLAWLLAREAHQLREEAADDAVLAANIAGTDYAALLVGIARHERNGLLLGAHGVAPSRDSLRRRVQRVLDKTPARGRSGSSWVAGFTFGMMVMAVPLAAVSFGPARASEERVSFVHAAPAAAPAPQRLLPGAAAAAAPALHAHKDESARLAAAIDSMPAQKAPDQASESGAATDDDSRAGPDMSAIPDFAATWARAGAEFGARYAEFGKRFGQAIALQALRPAPPARPMPAAAPAPQPQDFGISSERWLPSDLAYGDPNDRQAALDVMLGVSEAFRKDIVQAGFPKATRGQLFYAQSVGLTGECIRALRAAGLDGSLNDYAMARSNGVDADYVRALRAAGLSGSVHDFVRARSVGLDDDYVRMLRAAGLDGSFNDFVQARAMGFPAGYVTAMKALGINASLSEYQQMRAIGVTSGFVRRAKEQGFDTSPRSLIKLKSLAYANSIPRNGDP